MRRLFIVLTFTLLTLMSCGRDKNRVSNYSSGAIGTNYLISSTFSSEDVTTLNKVCTLFRTKRVSFTSLQSSKIFSTEINNKDCEKPQGVKKYNGDLEVKQLLSSGPIYLDGSLPISYFSIMQTDRDGELKTICDDVLSDRTPKKVVNEGNDSTMYQVLFANEYGGVDVIRKIKGPRSDASSSILAKEIVELKVISSSDKFTAGVVKEIVKKVQCSEYPEQSSVFIQTVLSETN
ncbi:hypothetical protein [Bacteriovorax sp. BSW11_IV]|uniref:hypothetical protein n=1 Tax=Bacteriovorax sp. BSW11_IV TaxID=1353529 RepID=UPI0012DBE0A5|nr:hypothetical protein [Bacteriovorax sp. BSW11_IV]